ncbi:MAG TPA: hypothetical protein HPQ00_10920, partial [Magnetococcales bacterium]|nr:hypothetical protein [Magnetococcales bacterium]
MPVPITYGQSRSNGMVVHARIYGGNYEKAHYLVVLGEVGITLDQLYIDKYRIEDLTNYYTRTGGNQNSDSAWYVFYPQGGQAQISLNNSGTWNIFQLTNAVGDVAAPVPVTLYGGGTVTCYSYHTWPKEGSTQSWRWVLVNIDDPNQIRSSDTFTETFSTSQTVSCFPLGTMVSTPCGDVAIESICPGDAVIAYDDEGHLHHALVEDVSRHFKQESLVYLHAGPNFLVVTDTHYILVKDKGFIQADAIRAGDIVFDREQGECRVSSTQIKRTGPEIHTYNLIVAEYSTYIANNIRVHNGGGGKGSSTVDSPGNVLRSHVFEISNTLSRWSLKLEVLNLSGGDLGGQAGIYKFDITDVPYSENPRINAAFVHVHLVKDASLGSNNPVISGLVHAGGVSGMGGNPADALLIFLTDPVVGLGLPGGIVDGTSQFATSYWCEQKGLGFNRTYASFYDSDQVLREICTAGRIITLVRDGKIYLKPDDIEPATYKVGEIEIVPGSLRAGIQSSSRPNRIEGQYVEPFYGYTIERVYAEDLNAIARDGLQIQTVDLTGVTNQTQAYRLAHFILRTIQDCPYWCRFTVGMETARVIPVGSVIEIESTTNSIVGARQWRVLSIEEVESFIYQIECAQYNASVYDEPSYSPWYNQIAELEAVQGWPGPPAGPAAVVNFQIVNTVFPSSGGTEITVDWVKPTQRYDTASIQWSHDGANWTSV